MASESSGTHDYNFVNKTLIKPADWSNELWDEYLKYFNGASITPHKSPEDWLRHKQRDLASYTLGGAKFDDNKRRDDLFPVDAFQSISEVLTFGAKKYSDRNWEKGMKWGRLYRATLGHLMEWWKGNDLDEETGLPHLAHAATCVIFLLSYHLRSKNTAPRNEWDDRPL